MENIFDASIIIPVYNGLSDTERCLIALGANTDGAKFEVIIVDNASSDGTPEFLATLGGDVRIITNTSNLGFAKACNQGARAAAGRYIVLLNNDTIPQPGWLGELIAIADAEPTVAIVGSRLIYPGSSRIQHAGIVFGPLREPYHIYQNIDAEHEAVNAVEEFQAVTAACMLVRREVLLEAGLFDEQYVNGYEDIDLCLKVRALGHRIMYTPKSVLYHAEFSTAGRKDRQAENMALFLKLWKNKIEPDEEYYYKKHGHKIVYDPKDPRKYTLMTADKPACEIVTGASDQPSLRVTGQDGSVRTVHSMHDPMAEAALMADAVEFEGDGLLVVLGAGLGYHIDALLMRFPDAELVVVEPLSEIYEAARDNLPENVNYIVGKTSAEALREIASLQLKCGMNPMGLFILHPEAAAFPTLFNPLIESLRRTLSVKLWNRLRYEKFTAERVSVMVLDSGYMLIRDVVRAFQRQGHKVMRVSVGKTAGGEAMIEAILGGIVEFKPDFILAVNHLGFDEDGVLTDFLGSVEMPVASWFVDSPSLIIGDYGHNVSPYVAMLLWEQDYVPTIQKMGFEHVRYLPLGTDETVFAPMRTSPKDRKRYAAKIGFVGDSMVTAAAKKLSELPPHLREKVQEASELVAHADRMRSLASLLEEVAPELEGPQRTAFEAAVLWRATLMYRLECLQALEGAGQFAIYGDVEGWRKLGVKAEIRPKVSYYETLPLVYNCCDINFNATSMQMRTAVNQRVFDVPACGAFLLTDHQNALEGLFEVGREVITYSSPEEAREWVRYYINNPNKRDDVADLARKRVLAEHTYTHRINAIIDIMREAYS